MASARVGSIVETADSPQFDYGKNLTCTRIYVGTLAECQGMALRPGIVGTGDMSGYISEGSNITGIGGTNYRLTIKYIAYGAEDLPQDEYSVETFEINPRLEKHPHYKGMAPEHFEMVNVAVEASDPQTRKQALEFITEVELAYELAIAKIGGQDSYYLPGLKYIWSQHYPVDGVPSLSLGGTIETPGGPCANYLPPGATWLREADKLAWTGTVWKVTRVWIGAPVGHWNTNIYPAG